VPHRPLQQLQVSLLFSELARPMVPWAASAPRCSQSHFNNSKCPPSAACAQRSTHPTGSYSPKAASTPPGARPLRRAHNNFFSSSVCCFWCESSDASSASHNLQPPGAHAHHRTSTPRRAPRAPPHSHDVRRQARTLALARRALPLFSYIRRRRGRGRGRGQGGRRLWTVGAALMILIFNIL
jgi:hypothetical protein